MARVSVGEQLLPQSVEPAQFNLPMVLHLMETILNSLSIIRKRHWRSALLLHGPSSPFRERTAPPPYSSILRRRRTQTARQPHLSSVSSRLVCSVWVPTRMPVSSSMVEVKPPTPSEHFAISSSARKACRTTPPAPPTTSPSATKPSTAHQRSR